MCVCVLPCMQCTHKLPAVQALCHWCSGVRALCRRPGTNQDSGLGPQHVPGGTQLPVYFLHDSILKVASLCT